MTVLTAQWDPSWPHELTHRSVRVVRLPQPPERVMGTWHYMRELGRWLRQRRDQFDLLYVSQLKHDAYVAVRAGRSLNKPVVLRAAGAGTTGDCHWQTVGRCGRLIRRQTRHASAIVAPSSAIEAELIAAGYAAEQIVRIDSGVPLPEPPSPERRRQARRTLAGANPAMSLADATRLVVFTGRLHDVKQLEVLITAWRQVVQRHQDVRLWLAGEGPERDALERQIRELRLQGLAALIGSFDCVEDLLFAADLFVLPSKEEGLSQSLLEAMAAGLPAVVSDIPGNRTLIDDRVHGLVVPVSDAAALADGVGRLLDAPAWRLQLGAAGRMRAAERYSLEQMVAKHLELLDRLLAGDSRR